MYLIYCQKQAYVNFIKISSNRVESCLDIRVILRSSHPGVLFEEAVLKNFARFKERNLKRNLKYVVFFSEFSEIFQNSV